MKVYFLSSQPCALTINDAYFGLTDRFERFAEISLKDRSFVRFTPEGALPISFFLTENIRFSPPKGCEVYLLTGGLAIYARDFPPFDLSLQVLFQKRFDEGTLTLFLQGTLQLSLETREGFFVATLPPSFSNCEAFCESGLFLLKAPDSLAVYTQKGECVLQEKVLSHRVENGVLSAILPLSDSLGRIAECEWSLSESGVERTKFSLSQARTQKGECERKKIKDELLPFAFFESVLIGANYREMLSDELAPDYDKIKEYLGDFCAVTLTDDPNVCGLVRKKGERLFEVANFTVRVENDKICDIQG